MEADIRKLITELREYPGFRKILHRIDGTEEVEVGIPEEYLPILLDCLEEGIEEIIHFRRRHEMHIRTCGCGDEIDVYLEKWGIK